MESHEEKADRHVEEAERLLAQAHDKPAGKTWLLAEAQLHATLAVVHATFAR